MNRVIKFRGKAKNNRWFHGSLLKDWAGTCQIWEKDEYNALNNFIVERETVGQFTGLHDKNGKEIYEGDIVSYKYIDNERNSRDKNVNIEGIAECVFKDGCFMFKCITGDFYLSEERAIFAVEYLRIPYKIIGNIHDNPEILKKEQPC